MAVSFLRNLEDSSSTSYCGVSSWNDDEDSFEVSEVANAATSDINLAEALQALDDTHGSGDVQAAAESQESLQPRKGRVGSVKDELRTKIQARRLSEGVGELQISFAPPKTYPLTTEEKCKVEKRKHRNRMSANKSRNRRKTHEECLLKEVDKLETVNGKILKDIHILKKLKYLLNQSVQTHRCTKRQSVMASSAALAASESSRTFRVNEILTPSRQTTSPHYITTR